MSPGNDAHKNVNAMKVDGVLSGEDAKLDKA